MANYNAPDVYIKDVVKGSQSVTQLSSSVGILVGVTRSGVVNKAQKIGSWTEFLFKYYGKQLSSICSLRIFQ